MNSIEITTIADIGGTHEVDLEAGHNSEDPMLQRFFEQVRSVQNGLDVMRKSMQNIQQLSQEEAPTEIDRIIEATNLVARDVRTTLKQMNEETISIKDQVTVAQFRIRQNLQCRLVKNFLQLMQVYEDIQNTCKNKSREGVTTQYRTVKPEATDEEIDTVIESGNIKFFSQAFVEDEKQEATKQLSYFQKRLQDVRYIEKSIQELHQLYEDVSLIITSQGDIVDNIESNIITSQIHVKNAVLNLNEAMQKKKSSRKKMCCLLVILLLILIAAGIIAGIIVPKMLN